MFDSAQPTLLATRHLWTMPIHSVTELIDALSMENFDALVGTLESSWLEFHRDCYSIDAEGKLTAKGKWELAKDVGGFANRDGGFIVLGVDTRREPTAVGDTAVEIRPIRKDTINAATYHDVIQRWLYPRVRNVTMRWFPKCDEATEGLFLIEVRAQDDNSKLFLLRRVVDEDDREHATGNFAVPIREGDRTELMSAEECQRLISDGRHAGRTGPVGHLTSSLDDDKERAGKTAFELEVRNNWEEAPVYILYSFPPSGGPVPIPDFYERHGLWQALYEPGQLRAHGFSLRHGGTLEPVEGGWYAGRPEHHALWLEEDGYFVAAGPADPEFLGWAKNRLWQPGQSVEINPLTLVEFTLEFFRFVHRELMPRAPGQWRHRLLCRRFKTGKVLLPAGPLREFPGWSTDPHAATTDDYERAFEATDDAGRDAYAALELLYRVFSLGASAIPYKEDGRISEDLIRGAG